MFAVQVHQNEFRKHPTINNIQSTFKNFDNEVGASRLNFEWRPEQHLNQKIRYINSLHVIEKNAFTVNSTVNIDTEQHEESQIENTLRENENSVRELMQIGTIRNLEVNANQTANFQILIADDQEFNLQALEIVLQYKLKIDVDNICVKAVGGQ